MTIDNIEKEIEYLLHTLDGPITAKRITATLCAPYSHSKNAFIEASFENLFNSKKVIKSKCQFVEDVAWQILGDLPDNSQICHETLRKLLQKRINIDKFLKHFLYSFIKSSPFPVTLNRISLYLSENEFQEFLDEDKVVDYISIFENEFKIKKVKVEGFGVPAWRQYSQLIDNEPHQVENKIKNQKIDVIPKIYDEQFAEEFLDIDEHLTILKNIVNSAVDIYYFHKLKTITIKQASILSSSNVELIFNELPEISREAASIFATRDKVALFPGIKKLPDTDEHIQLIKNNMFHDSYILDPDKYNLSNEIGIKIAKILAENNKGLYINGIKIISDELAEIFSHHEYLTYFDLLDYIDNCEEDEYNNYIAAGLFDLRLESLEELKDCPGHIKLAKKFASQSSVHLPNLESLSCSCALELAKHKHDLYLDGITTLPDNIANILSECECFVSVLSLEELTDSKEHIRFSEKLSRQKYVKLPNLSELSKLSAAALCKTYGDIYLDNLFDIPDDVALELSKHKGILNLPLIGPLLSTPGHINLGIKLLSQICPDKNDEGDEGDEGDPFENIFGTINENHLKYPFFNKKNIALDNENLSNELAIILANHCGKIELPKLKALSSSNEDINLVLRLALQEKVDLPNLISLTLPAAEAVSSAFEIYLDSLPTIEIDIATALAKNQGVLSLNGLTEICDAVALALSEHNGFLFLNGLKYITESSSFLKLANKLNSQDSIELEGLKFISNQAAAILSECNGPIFLPYKILGDSEEHLTLRRKISAQISNRSYLFK